MKTDKILHLVQQKKAMRSGGALPLPKAQTGMPVTTADSLRVYNAQMALNKFYADEARKGRLKLDENRPLSDYEWNARRQETNLLNDKNLDFYRGEIRNRKERENTGRGSWKDDAYKEYFNLTPEQVKKLEYQGIARTNSGNDNIIYYRDLITPLQNLASPFAVIDTRIKPQRVIGYIASGGYPGGAVELYDYDPLAVKPFYLRTPQEQKQWEEKYGKTKVASASSPRLTAARKPETMQLMKSIPSRFESSDIDMQPVGRPVIPTPALPQMYMDMRGEWMMKPAISDSVLMNDPRFIQKSGYRKSEKKSGGLAKAQKGIVNQNAYDLWYKYNTPEGRAGIPDLYSDYDYRKYFEDAVTGVNPMGFDEESMHFPDTYKYPWHPSFSDESVYYVNQKETPGLSYQTKQKGGLTKAQEGLQFVPNGTYGNYYDPSTGQYIPQVYLPEINIVADKSLPFQDGKFAPFLAARGTADYVPLETVFLPGTPVVKGLGKVGNVLLDAVNPLAGMRNLKSSIPDYTPGPAYVEALERLNQTRAKYLDELNKLQESPQVGKSLGDITTDIDALNASIKPRSEATTGDLQNMLDQLRSINANLEQNVPLQRRAFTSSDISEQLARQAQDPGDMPGTGVSDVGEAISMQDRIKNFEDIQRQEGIGLSAKYLGRTPQGARFEFVPEKYMIEAKGLTGKGTTVKPEDFYTTSELQKKIDQLAAYNRAQAQFDEMNPLTGADMVMSALSGDKSRDELFQTLFPNVSIPNFNEKIIPPQYMSELREALKYLPSQYFQDPLNPKRTLKWDLQNRMREDSMPKSLADYLAQKSKTWHKEDPLGYAREMMGVNKTEGLSMDEIRRLAESKQNELTDWYRQRLLQDFNKPFTAGDAVRLGLNPNKMGGLTKSKAREILHDKSVHGHPLTDKQRKFFGAIASGKSYKVRVKKK